MSDMSIVPSAAALAAGACDEAYAKAQWRADIIREMQARGDDAETAIRKYGERDADFERCRRNRMTPAAAVTNVIGSWAESR